MAQGIDPRPGREPGFPSNVPFPSMTSEWECETFSDSLNKVYQATERGAQSRIDWYDTKASKFGGWARRIRRVTIILAGLGAVAPMLGQLLRPLLCDNEGCAVFESVLGAEFGYVALAVAAILAALDNFFGYTTGWMRYRVTQADLVRRLVRFRYDWAANLAAIHTQQPVSAEIMQRLLLLQRDFVDGCEAVVERETQLWADRLEVSIAALESKMHSRAGDSSLPWKQAMLCHEDVAIRQLCGSLAVTVRDWTSLQSESVTLTLDGKPLILDDTGCAQCEGVAAGIHELRLTAKRKVDDSELKGGPVSVTVAPGVTTSAQM